LTGTRLKVHGAGQEGMFPLEGIEVKHRTIAQGTDVLENGLYLTPCTLNLTPFPFIDDKGKFI